MQNSTSPITTRRYFITGSQRLSNFFWASLIFLGGAGFLLTGFFSFLSRSTPSLGLVGQSLPSFELPEQGFPLLQEQNIQSSSLQIEQYAKEGFNFFNFSILPLANSSIRFFPQGLIMCFYGCSALIFSLYLWLTIFWKVGNGFNEFNKESGVVRIFRWGLPGKDRRIDLRYSLKDIEALRVTLKEGINPRRTIALQIKGKGEIPLTRIGEPMALQDIENQASELANFLKIEIQVLAA